ncbi:MAG: hypothetical protein GX465_17465 [Acidobacteria bacterium]|nr:hypothetical protein [Acidobacteriota bacterium]
MHILITTENCPNCRKLRNKLNATGLEFIELKIEENNAPAIISKLRTSNIFKTEMPILVKEMGDEWEEVECK